MAFYLVKGHLLGDKRCPFALRFAVNGGAYGADLSAMEQIFIILNATNVPFIDKKYYICKSLGCTAFTAARHTAEKHITY